MKKLFRRGEDKLVEKIIKISDKDYIEFMQEINIGIENIYDIIMKNMWEKQLKENSEREN